MGNHFSKVENMLEIIIKQTAEKQYKSESNQTD